MTRETRKERKEREEFDEANRKGAERSRKDEMTISLARACINGWHKKAGQLIENGADPNFAYSNPSHRSFVLGTIPMMFQVIMKGRTKVIDVLIKHGANFRFKTADDQKTPLHVAAGYGELDIIALLIKAGADINAADRDGHTPIFHADTPETAELLIKGGADITIRDKNGFTPLSFFTKLRYQSRAAVLEKQENMLKERDFEEELGNHLAEPTAPNKPKLGWK